jgi:AP2 domain
MEIPISGRYGIGKTLLIDEDDVVLLQGRSVWMHGTSGGEDNGYPSIKLNSKIVAVHRLVAASMGLSGQIDHENRDTCDSRRSNLREATPTQNGRNRGMQGHNTSGLKGVSWDKAQQKWRAVIRVEGVLSHLGRFNCPFEAARAYDRKALEVDPIYAETNFSLGLLPECQEVAQ